MTPTTCRVCQQIDAMEGRFLAAAQTAALDQFHIRGLVATAELAQLVGLTTAMQVLDAGSGLGVPSRYLAETYGCSVVGLDLTPSYVALSRHLAQRSMAAERLRYELGNLLAMPFDDGAFDLVWTQHVVMNIRDRNSLYRDVRRVLKKGGRFAFYDPYVAENGQPPHYPTPWAESAEHSTLLTREQTAAAYAQAGLKLVAWDDVSDLGKAWIERQQQQLQQLATAPGGPAPSPGWVVGARMQPMVANFARNIKEDRIRLVMGICVAH